MEAEPRTISYQEFQSVDLAINRLPFESRLRAKGRLEDCMRKRLLKVLTHTGLMYCRSYTPWNRAESDLEYPLLEPKAKIPLTVFDE